jgi:antitoxin (DNA-binding transcriptional repressor) of toxin-antitoxin stability system
MTTAPASEVQKNFGEWHDRAYEGPVEITRYGRTTAFLVSAPLFREMWASFRKAIPAEDLSDSEVNLILESKVETDQPYNLDDIPDDDE